MLLPAGEDPDSFIKSKGVEAFKEYLAQNRQEFVGSFITSSSSAAV